MPSSLSLNGRCVMPPRWQALLVLALVLQSGCAPLAPHYAPPALPVAAQYGLEDAPPSQPPAATLDWRSYFTDPLLQSWITQALEHNRDLRSAALRVQEARAAYGIQHAELSPSIGAQVGLDRSRTPADLNMSRQPQLGSQYQVGLGMATWEIDFWGRLRYLSDAALETYLASDAARQAVALGLITQVAQGYLALRELDEHLTLARQTRDNRTQSLRLFTRRVNAGAASRLQLTSYQTLLTQAEAQIAQWELARARQVHALTLLLGQPITLPANTAHWGEAPLAPLQAGLPSDLLVHRPDIVAAEHQLRAAHAQIGAARAAFFPRIALTGLAGSASAELGGLFDNGSAKWAFSPSITLPLFTSGRLRDNLQLQEVRRDMAVAQYEKAVQMAFREVVDALAARQGLTTQLHMAQQALSVQGSRTRLMQQRHAQGASTLLELLDAQRDLLQAQQQVLQLRYALLTTQTGLYAALGGGPLTEQQPAAPPSAP